MLGVRFVVQHRRIERRAAEEQRRLVALQEIEHEGRSVGRAGLSTLVAPTDDREGQRIAEAVGEEEFRRREVQIALADAEYALAIELGRLHQARMNVARTFRRAGRARRIEPERRLVGMAVGGVEMSRLAREGLAEVDRARPRLAADDDHMREIGQFREDRFENGQERAGDAERTGARIRQHVEILLRDEQRVEGNRRRFPRGSRRERRPACRRCRA